MGQGSLDPPTQYTRYGIDPEESALAAAGTASPLPQTSSPEPHGGVTRRIGAASTARCAPMLRRIGEFFDLLKHRIASVLPGARRLARRRQAEEGLFRDIADVIQVISNPRAEPGSLDAALERTERTVQVLERAGGSMTDSIGVMPGPSQRLPEDATYRERLRTVPLEELRRRAAALGTGRGNETISGPDEQRTRSRKARAALTEIKCALQEELGRRLQDAARQAVSSAIELNSRVPPCSDSAIACALRPSGGLLELARVAALLDGSAPYTAALGEIAISLKDMAIQESLGKLAPGVLESLLRRLPESDLRALIEAVGNNSTLIAAIERSKQARSAIEAEGVLQGIASRTPAINPTGVDTPLDRESLEHLIKTLLDLGTWWALAGGASQPDRATMERVRAMAGQALDVLRSHPGALEGLGTRQTCALWSALQRLYGGATTIDLLDPARRHTRQRLTQDEERCWTALLSDDDRTNGRGPAGWLHHLVALERAQSEAKSAFDILEKPCGASPLLAIPPRQHQPHRAETKSRAANPQEHAPPDDLEATLAVDSPADDEILVTATHPETRRRIRQTRRLLEHGAELAEQAGARQQRDRFVRMAELLRQSIEPAQADDDSSLPLDQAAADLTEADHEALYEQLGLRLIPAGGWALVHSGSLTPSQTRTMADFLESLNQDTPEIIVIEPGHQIGTAFYLEALGGSHYQVAGSQPIPLPIPGSPPEGSEEEEQEAWWSKVRQGREARLADVYEALIAQHAGSAEQAHKLTLHAHRGMLAGFHALCHGPDSPLHLSEGTHGCLLPGSGPGAEGRISFTFSIGDNGRPRLEVDYRVEKNYRSEDDHRPGASPAKDTMRFLRSDGTLVHLTPDSKLHVHMCCELNVDGSLELLEPPWYSFDLRADEAQSRLGLASALSVLPRTQNQDQPT